MQPTPPMPATTTPPSTPTWVTSTASTGCRTQTRQTCPQRPCTSSTPLSSRRQTPPPSASLATSPSTTPPSSTSSAAPTEPPPPPPPPAHPSQTRWTPAWLRSASSCTACRLRQTLPSAPPLRRSSLLPSTSARPPAPPLSALSP